MLLISLCLSKLMPLTNRRRIRSSQGVLQHRHSHSSLQARTSPCTQKLSHLPYQQPDLARDHPTLWSSISFHNHIISITIFDSKLSADQALHFDTNFDNYCAFIPSLHVHVGLRVTFEVSCPLRTCPSSRCLTHIGLLGQLPPMFVGHHHNLAVTTNCQCHALLVGIRAPKSSLLNKMYTSFAKSRSIPSMTSTPFAIR